MEKINNKARIVIWNGFIQEIKDAEAYVNSTNEFGDDFPTTNGIKEAIG